MHPTPMVLAFALSLLAVACWPLWWML